MSQSPAEQSVAGAGRAPAKQGARGRAAHEGRGRAAGGASPVDSPTGGRMEVRSDSPAGGRDGGSWGTIYCCELGTGRWGQKPAAVENRNEKTRRGSILGRIRRGRGVSGRE